MKQRRGPPPSETDNEDDIDRGPSKTALKQQALELQQLGRAVSELPASRRRAIDMPEDLSEAIEAYVRMTAHGARKRQLQYLGKLLRGIDSEPLRRAVENFEQGRAEDAEQLHKIERWRDQLIDNDQAVTHLIDNHPDCDVQRLRSLIRAARREGAAEDITQRQPKSYRELFKFLKPLLKQDGRLP